MNFFNFLPILPIYDMNYEVRVPRQPQKRIDPLEYYDDEKFRKRFRFSKNTFRIICDEIDADVGHPTRRQYALSTADQLAIALRFYATGSFQQVVGDTFLAVSQPAVSKTVREVSIALARKLDQYVCFPDDDNRLRSIMKGFHEINGFPGVVGAVDGTHIRIQSPSGDQEPYYVNRKQYHSINVQCICDHEQKFLNVVADWPGSAHDSRILTCSKIGIDFDAGDRRGILLGDSGYPCKSWLLTPFLNPVSPAQTRYNDAHTRTRQVIERTFGLWKRRFHVLHSEIRMSPIRVCRIIGACAVLHNMAKENHEPDFDDDQIDENDNQDAVVFHGREEGQTFRNHFVQQYFSH